MKRARSEVHIITTFLKLTSLTLLYQKDTGFTILKLLYFQKINFRTKLYFRSDETAVVKLFRQDKIF
ncbi:hypothetical protein HMPREF9391_0677 [Streptococcus sanguinis SK408]|uniref:Uncharacterized protein n=1 Tax=Streptococcus sanguinis SK408 TaxID=888818 RepID=F2CCW7_STRSA|nr:hypothetical protein HMPREF9391_0677 [Streptococcus sanguinis SK408]PLA64846.1 hypothetical protein CYK23_02555 [Streptococcus salivarius]